MPEEKRAPADSHISSEINEIEARKAAIRARFAEIQPFGDALFVNRADSDEVLELAEELEALDRHLQDLREQARPVDEYPIIPPLAADSLVDSLIEDMEGF